MITRIPVVLASVFLFAAGSTHARVVRFEVTHVRTFASGTTFGSVGQYQRLDGTAYFEVDPRDPHNAVIVNLDKAPRNARGNVEFSAPFFILKPTVMSRGNGRIFYVINNRGNKQALGYFNYALAGPGINDPITTADAGDGFLMRLGYTVVDAGWQGDVAHPATTGSSRASRSRCSRTVARSSSGSGLSTATGPFRTPGRTR